MVGVKAPMVDVLLCWWAHGGSRWHQRRVPAATAAAQRRPARCGSAAPLCS